MSPAKSAARRYRIRKGVIAPHEHPGMDPFWFYKQVVVSNDQSGIVPEIMIPGGDDSWTSPDGRTVKWPDGWRGCWETIMTEFGSAKDACSEHEFLSPSLLRTYEPNSAKAWLRRVDDAQTGKKRLPPQEQDVAHWRLLTDVFVWALACVLEYCRYRLGLGQWSFRKGNNYRDVADTWFIPRSQRACKFLVNWFIRFANARLRFYHHIEMKIIAPWHSQTMPAVKSVKKIINGKRGRSARVRIGPHAKEDLWLILIWPVAFYHRWSCRDIVRSVRLHFGCDHKRRPVGQMTREEVAKTIRGYFNRESSLPKRIDDVRKELLHVTASDGESMRIRCKRLGLERLKPGRRDREAKPRFFDLVNGFHADQMPQS